MNSAMSERHADAMRTTALASAGDAISQGTAEFDGMHDRPSADLVREIGDACCEAVRQMARGPDSARAVQATLTQTADDLRAVTTMVSAGTIAPDLVDGVARAAIGKLLGAFHGNGATLDRVEVGGLTAPGRLTDADIEAGDVPLLSAARDGYLVHKNGSDEQEWCKDGKRARRQIDAFIDYAGDRPLTEYGIADIEDYARDLRCLPLRADTVKDANGVMILKGKPISDQIEYGRAHPELRRISQGTIKHGYIATVRSAVTWQCRRAKPRLKDPFDGAQIAKPAKATQRSYRPLPISVVNKAISMAAAEHNLLAPLFVLALLTTRRLAVLTYINGNWLERHGRHWVCRPTPIVTFNNHPIDLPEKTPDSLRPFVLHEALIDAGIVDAMKDGQFLFAPLLTSMAPAAALSKRTNRLLQDAGAGGRVGGEVFHSLRTGGIVHYRRHVPEAARLQAGHAAADDHEAYDFDDVTGDVDSTVGPNDPGVDFGALNDTSLVARVATVPLPRGLDLTPLGKFDMARAITLANRNAQSQDARRASRSGTL